jgi:hypothetical protein
VPSFTMRMMIPSKTFPIVIALVLILLLSCGGWVENRTVMKQAPENEDISPDLVRANIATTDYSAIVFIQKGKVNENPVLRRLGGYVNHIYRARVLETLRGPRYETITFSVMAESDIDPILPQYPVIVSLCGKSRDAMYVPDNGYELPASTRLSAAAREASRRVKATLPGKGVCSE